MLTLEAIKTYIDNDKGSDRKKKARIGQRYYDAEHDILKYKIMYLDKSKDELVEDTTKANARISHPFFTELVDQEVQHMLSETDSIFKSDDPDLQGMLDDYFNNSEQFMEELYEALTDCISKGFAYVYAYKTKEGKTGFQCADSMGVIEVKAKETDDGCEYVIFWYVDHIGKDNKKITRVQVWDEKQTWFYVQEENGQLQEDESEKVNPRPHVLYTKDGDGSTYFENFGFIPFFRLDNCKKQKSGLWAIKGLIDDYDLMACGLSNNIQDMAEAYIAVSGFDGDNLDELAVNWRAKKHIGVGDGGSIDIKTVDIPYQARQAKLELDEKNIYRFGMGFNAAQGSADMTDDEVQSRYVLLDMKCNKLEIRLKSFLRRLLKVVLAEINAENGTDYQQKDVYFKFKRKTVTNQVNDAQVKLSEAQKRQTEINTILTLREVIGDETMMELIAEQLDIDLDDLNAKRPKPEDEPTVYAQTIASGITAEDEVPEGDMSA